MARLERLWNEAIRILVECWHGIPGGFIIQLIGRISRRFGTIIVVGSLGTVLIFIHCFCCTMSLVSLCTAILMTIVRICKVAVITGMAPISWHFPSLYI